jgi:hypothetical protein
MTRQDPLRLEPSYRRHAQPPTFEIDRNWPKVPAQWKLGDVSSFSVDAQDRIWALHRPRTLIKPEDVPKRAPAVMVFDAGVLTSRVGAVTAQAIEWPQREHGINIDSKGFVWITGNNCPTNGIANLKHVADDQILKFTQDGKFVLQIGHSNQSKGNADTTNVHRAADVQYNARTNELFVADGYGNHRVVVFDADSGKFKRMWGAFGNKPVDDDHCEVVTPQSFPPATVRRISASSTPSAVEGRHRLRRGPREPPRPVIHRLRASS